jgi:drug/metabolite transporter (DMT)-like permease
VQLRLRRSAPAPPAARRPWHRASLRHRERARPLAGSRDHYGLALSGALSLIWGLTFVVQRFGLRDSDAIWFAAGRAATATIALAPGLAAIRALSASDHLLAVALGLMNVTAFFAFQLEGIERIGAGPSAAIVFTQPLMVLVLAALLLGEQISLRRLSGAILGLAGVSLVAMKEWTLGSPAGVTLLLLAALAWAIGSVLLRAAAHRPLLPLLSLQMLYGAIPLIALAIYHAPPPSITQRLAFSVVYAGVVATAGGWLVLAFLLRRADAASVSAALYFVPVVGVIFGALLLSEPLRPSLLIGMVLISLGVRLVTTPSPSG